MNIHGTDFVVYPVSDLRRAAAFYRDVLGLPQEVYNDEWGWAEFNCGNTTLALHAGEAPPEPGAGARMALAVEDVQAARDELKQRGVHVVKEPQDFSVCWAMEIADPDGNRVILHRRNDGTFGT